MPSDEHDDHRVARDAESAAGEPPADAAPDEAAGAAAEPALDELESLRRECEALREKHLRALADAQNLRQRMQREKTEALRYAEAEFARDLLVILDDLERTCESARTAPDAAAVAEGVRIVYEHFLKLLRNRGVRPIEALGHTFDPSYHEALLRRPDPDRPAGTVVEELARGYQMHERVLRPARVVIASEPPAELEPDDQEED